MYTSSTKGLRFLPKNKAVVDLKMHGDIMEDAIDRITIKEAKQKGEFVDWDDAKKTLDKKHKLHGIHNSNRKAAVKISGNNTKKRLR